MKGNNLSNLHIFPLLKKYPSKNNEEKIDIDNIPKNEVEEIAFHYTKQLVHAFHNQGFPDTGLYFQDIDFLQDVLQSILLRAVNKHHPLQDLIGEIYEDNNSETEEEIEESE